MIAARDNPKSMVDKPPRRGNAGALFPEAPIVHEISRRSAVFCVIEGG